MQSRTKRLGDGGMVAFKRAQKRGESWAGRACGGTGWHRWSPTAAIIDISLVYQARRKLRQQRRVHLLSTSKLWSLDKTSERAT